MNRKGFTPTPERVAGILSKKKSARLVSGFTLIELLIVIAIIGILASSLLVGLGGARSSARDARRISDLRQVQSALELYFNKSGQYPGSASWSDLTTAITTAGIGVNAIPQDPGGSPATYTYAADGTNQRYVLRAVLEKSNAALNNDLDDKDIPSGITVNGGCEDATFNYCISL